MTTKPSPKEPPNEPSKKLLETNVDSTQSILLTPSQLKLPTLSALIDDVSHLDRYRPKGIVRKDDELPVGQPSDQDSKQNLDGSGDVTSSQNDVLRLVAMSHDYPLANIKPFRETDSHVTVQAYQPETFRNVLVTIAKNIATAEECDRLLAESKALANLKHPSIPKVYFFGKLQETFPYCVFELVEGHSLCELLPGLHLANAKIDWRKGSGAVVLRHLRDAANAINFANSHGIYHLNLQLENLKVSDRDKVVKLLDWRHLKTPTEASQTTAEDMRSLNDLLGLGESLYRMIYNEPAPTADQTTSNAGPTRMQIPSELDAIICKSLSRDPNRRYPSASALADDLDRFLNGKAVNAYVDKLSWVQQVAYRTLRMLRVPTA